MMMKSFASAVVVLIVVFTFEIAPAAVPNPPDLQRPPARRPSDAPRLPSILETADGASIQTATAWRAQRERLRRDWMEFLGQFPIHKAPLRTEILQTEVAPGFVRQHIRYQSEEGVFTDGYLLSPTNARSRLPAVVVFHPTTPLHAKGVAGIAPEYSFEKQQGIQLVSRGYVVWCPRNFIFEDESAAATNSIKAYTDATQKLFARHPSWKGMTRMIWDGIRAADFLESLPTVDARRIGCLGHSLGGKQALFAAAFDERYKAAVASELGIGLRFSNWEAPWYLGAEIRRTGFPLENHQILALIAPRAFLLLAGDSADNDKSWTFIDSVAPVYRLLGVSQNLGWFNHHAGHQYPSEARSLAESFVGRHLKNGEETSIQSGPPR